MSVALAIIIMENPQYFNQKLEDLTSTDSVLVTDKWDFFMQYLAALRLVKGNLSPTGQFLESQMRIN